MSTSSASEVRTSKRARRVRTMAKVSSLESLRGAHPEALRDLYQAGSVVDPTTLAKAPAGEALGMLLSIELWAKAFLVTRPLVVGASKYIPGWRGKSFESGGTSGSNLVLGRRMFRFRCEVEPSELDGEPTLMLRYDQLGNPWPVRSFVDELRRVGQNVCLGTASLQRNNRSDLMFWWGLKG